MKSPTDRSGSVGGRRSKTGNDMTAGNSVTRPGKRRSFQSSRTEAVAKESTRFEKNQIHGGRKDSLNRG
jgi:hypothetical protein